MPSTPHIEKHFTVSSGATDAFVRKPEISPAAFRV